MSDDVKHALIILKLVVNVVTLGVLLHFLHPEWWAGFQRWRARRFIAGLKRDVTIDDFLNIAAARPRRHPEYLDVIWWAWVRQQEHKMRLAHPPAPRGK